VAIVAYLSLLLGASKPRFEEPAWCLELPERVVRMAAAIEWSGNPDEEPDEDGEDFDWELRADLAVMEQLAKLDAKPGGWLALKDEMIQAMGIPRH
jgi:hypothetical protein